jgi:hypothetical protein
VALIGAGCQQTAEPTTAQDITPETWWNPLTWANDELIQHLEAQRAQESFQNRIRFLALASATIFVVGGIVGPPIADFVRTRVTASFKLTTAQVEAAVTVGFIGAVGLLLILMLAMESARLLAPALFILIGGAAYELRANVLPALREENREKFKGGVSRIKTMALLAAVFIMALNLVASGLVNATALGDG